MASIRLSAPPAVGCSTPWPPHWASAQSDKVTKVKPPRGSRRWSVIEPSEPNPTPERTHSTSPPPLAGGGRGRGRSIPPGRPPTHVAVGDRRSAQRNPARRDRRPLPHGP